MSNDLDEMLKQEPTLTLEPFTEYPSEKLELAESRVQEPAAEEELKVVLTPEEQAKVDEFAAMIDLNNSQAILQYGAGP